jgi:hypothetical protein
LIIEKCTCGNTDLDFSITKGTDEEGFFVEDPSLTCNKCGNTLPYITDSSIEDENKEETEHKCFGCFYFTKRDYEQEATCKYTEYTEGTVFWDKWDSMKKCK